MKAFFNRKLSLMAMLLVIAILLGSFAACSSPGNGENESKESTSTSESVTEDKGSESESASESESEKESDSESDTENNSETESEILLEGPEAELIAYANKMANKVQSYYTDDARSEYVITNNQMNLKYNLHSTSDQLVSSLKDKEGNSYIENTMDVFVRMKDGKEFYASKSIVNASTNIFRLGYYYYENRISNQVFVDVADDSQGYEVDVKRTGGTNGVKVLSKTDEGVEFKISSSSDPWVSFKNVKFSTEDYQCLQLTIKGNSGIASNPQVFIMAGSYSQYTADQSIDFSITADGQFHTYTIPLNNIKDYTGDVKGLRLDINGSAGSTFVISSVKLISMGEGTPEELSLNRSFLTYSDKLHHIIQVVSSKRTENIDCVGMSTDIAADTVEKLVVKDKNGNHYSLEGVDWGSAEYVGFDIKNTGVFGYILPYDGAGGGIEVTLKDGVYKIIQTKKVEGGYINPSLVGTGNANDFYMGQRIYTDDSHSFDAFIHEAECERHPLTKENVRLDTRTYTGAGFSGYDSLYGYYKFTVQPAEGFNGPFFRYPNKHFGADFSITGDDLNRKIYVCAYTTAGSLECAALLDSEKMMLPIPIEVAKNFKGDGEDNIYMLDDATYGEAFLPLVINAGEKKEYTVLHLYQNWGHAPLKQISSIQYFSPYYHLSAGVTETNCVVVYGGSGLSLPDFRSMSAPYWKTQPQHNSCGSHSIVRYTNSDGWSIANQIEDVVIRSYGPTYADMGVDFISDDGNLRITYNHLELPQTDENRTFFEINIEVIGDVVIENFKEDFYFYNVSPNDPTGYYTRVGYLDKDNKSQVTDANFVAGEVKEYVLGNECPYFSFFRMENYTASYIEGYSNVAMIVYESDFVIGGKECEAPFVLRNPNKNLRLSLDLGEVTLKAGDTLSLKGILLPWGSQESVYDSKEFAPDQNVRDVREDSLLNPMTAKAIENCQVVESTFLPTLRTTNGKNATFSVKGGNNNVTARIYGFDKLTVPVIYELVDGKWVEYKVASVNTPDAQGFGYKYDGYNVFYDGDGTYSYSFVFEMNDGKERTFKIEAENDFKGWGDEDDVPVLEDLPLDVYVTADNYKNVGSAIGKFTRVEEDGSAFFRFNAVEGAISMTPYNLNSLYDITGQYAVLKYRIPESNEGNIGFFNVYAGTEGTTPTGKGDFVKCSVIVADGKWHVLVIDLSALPKFCEFDEGKYLSQYLRVDAVDNEGEDLADSNYIDFAYFGMSGSIEDICKLNSDIAVIDLYQGEAAKTVNTADCKINGEDAKPEITIPESTDLLNVYLPASALITTNTDSTGTNTELLSGGSMIRYHGKGHREAYIVPYKGSNYTVTGQYMVLKYRIPTDIHQSVGHIEIFTGTETSEATGNGDRINAVDAYVQDGEWKLMIVDASGLSGFKMNNGEYCATFIRFDVLNRNVNAAGYVDVAYVGADDSLEDICSFNSDMETAIFVTADSVKTVSLSELVE